MTLRVQDSLSQTPLDIEAAAHSPWNRHAATTSTSCWCYQTQSPCLTSNEQTLIPGVRCSLVSFAAKWSSKICSYASRKRRCSPASKMPWCNTMCKSAVLPRSCHFHVLNAPLRLTWICFLAAPSNSCMVVILCLRSWFLMRDTSKRSYCSHSSAFWNCSSVIVSLSLLSPT